MQQGLRTKAPKVEFLIAGDDPQDRTPATHLEIVKSRLYEVPDATIDLTIGGFPVRLFQKYGTIAIRKVAAHVHLPLPHSYSDPCVLSPPRP